MKNLRSLCLAIFCLIAVSAQAQKADSTSTKLLGKLIGTWQSQAVTKNGKDAAAKGAASALQTIKFREDAKYVIRQGNNPLDSGSYNTNEQLSTIYLQSATDKDHLQEWKVDLKANDMMSLTAKKGSKMQGMKYEYVKVKGTM